MPYSIYFYTRFLFPIQLSVIPFLSHFVLPSNHLPNNFFTHVLFSCSVMFSCLFFFPTFHPSQLPSLAQNTSAFSCQLKQLFLPSFTLSRLSPLCFPLNLSLSSFLFLLLQLCVIHLFHFHFFPMPLLSFLSPFSFIFFTPVSIVLFFPAFPSSLPSPPSCFLFLLYEHSSLHPFPIPSSSCTTCSSSFIPRLFCSTNTSPNTHHHTPSTHH